MANNVHQEIRKSPTVIICGCKSWNVCLSLALPRFKPSTGDVQLLLGHNSKSFCRGRQATNQNFTLVYEHQLIFTSWGGSSSSLLNKIYSCPSALPDELLLLIVLQPVEKPLSLMHLKPLTVMTFCDFQYFLQSHILVGWQHNKWFLCTHTHIH